jgi:putative MFS transporter
LTARERLVFALMGATMLFSGYDLNIFGLALPQIQRSLHIPENAAGLTVTYFRVAALAALLIAPLADRFGRRRLLLITIFGEAFFTVVTAFSQTYLQFVAAQILTRVFGYCEEALCFVVMAEEIDVGLRGWSTGALAGMNALGGGLASIVFALVNILPFGWRALYLVGGASLFLLALFRRRLPETARFETERDDRQARNIPEGSVLQAMAGLAREYPGRLSVLLICMFSAGFAFEPAAVLMAKFLQEHDHYQPWQITVLFIGGGTFAVWGNVFAGRSSDRFGRKRTLIVTMLVGVVSFGALYAGSGFVESAIAWVFAIFGYLGSAALLAGYPAEIFPTRYRATAATLRYTTITLGGALSLALEGPLYDLLHGHGPAILVLLAAAPVSIVAVCFLPEPARRALEDVSGDGPETATPA